MAACDEGPSGAKRQRQISRRRSRAASGCHAETTDRLMMLATDGRFFTLDCSKLARRPRAGEAIRGFIDLPPEADIVAMFVHKRRPQASARRELWPRLCHQRRRCGGDDPLGQEGDECRRRDQDCDLRFRRGDSVAVVGENRKLLIYPLEEVPELARGRGVQAAALQGRQPVRRARVHVERRAHRFQRPHVYAG